MSLKGKVAIVAGGARGIGAGIVEALAAAGASDNCKCLVKIIKAAGGQALCVQADISDLQAPSTIMAATLVSFGVDNIDILVNNAGLGQNTLLNDVALEQYDRLANKNVRAVIFMTQAVLPLISRGGRIVNMPSISARGGYSTQSIYAATKAVIEALTRVWATELGQQYGVTVNAVNPGPVDTEMYRAAGSVHLEEWRNRTRRSLRHQGVEDQMMWLVLLPSCVKRDLVGSQEM